MRIMNMPHTIESKQVCDPVLKILVNDKLM
jgi:hypothetical protein